MVSLEPSKPIWQSKTFWVNVIVLFIGVLDVVTGSNLIAAYPQIAGLLAMAIGILNVALRVITDQPVHLTE